MVEVGSLQIAGSINTTDIERGFSRINLGFDTVQSKMDGVNADFERMGQLTKKISTTFLGLGLAGGGFILALSKNAPALAGSLANMQVSFGKLARTLGEILAPAFTKVSEGFANFVGWIQEHQEEISFFTDNVLGGFIDGLQGIASLWSWITGNVDDFLVKIGINWDLGEIGNYLMEHFGAETVAAIIGGSIGGFFGGPAGAVIGATSGAGLMAVGRRVEDPQLGFEESVFVGGILSLVSSFSSSSLRRIVGLSLPDSL